MLRVGRPGNRIVKSTVAARLVGRGAVLVDRRLACDAVAPGSAGPAAAVDAFGDGALAADGSLDRPWLAAAAFDDPRQRDVNETAHRSRGGVRPS